MGKLPGSPNPLNCSHTFEQTPFPTLSTANNTSVLKGPNKSIAPISNLASSILTSPTSFAQICNSSQTWGTQAAWTRIITWLPSSPWLHNTKAGAIIPLGNSPWAYNIVSQLLFPEEYRFEAAADPGSIIISSTSRILFSVPRRNKVEK